MRLLDALLRHEDEVIYGLDLIEETGLSSGKAVPVLRLLVERGWVEAVWQVVAAGEPRRRCYRLTQLGRDTAPSYLGTDNVTSDDTQYVFGPRAASA